MDLIEKATVKAYHRNRFGGEDSHVLGYRNADSQTKRFEALLHWGDFSDCSIVDLGCGYGDFKIFLDDHAKNITYLGLDFVNEFIETAQERCKHFPDTHFIHADFLNIGLPKVDVVIASGSLNYQSNNPYHPWECISRMWEAANKGIVFNLLNVGRFEKDSILCGYDPAKVLTFCKYLDPNIQIFSGYLPDDFTVVMRK